MSEPAAEQQGPQDELTLAQVAERAGVAPGTVRRWVSMGLVPGYAGPPARWTPRALAYVRVVARLRARGHTLADIKHASDNGQLAIGPIEALLSSSTGWHTIDDAVAATGLDADMIERIYSTMGLGPLPADGDHRRGRADAALRRGGARGGLPRCPRSCS